MASATFLASNLEIKFAEELEDARPGPEGPAVDAKETMLGELSMPKRSCEALAETGKEEELAETAVRSDGCTGRPRSAAFDKLFELNDLLVPSDGLFDDMPAIRCCTFLVNELVRSLRGL